MNGELIGNLGNLVNRTLTFVSRYYNGAIPEGDPNETFWDEVRAHEQRVTELFERADLRDALREIFAIADIANKRFQDEEPWKARNENPPKAASLLRDLCYVLKDLSIMMHPYMPKSAERLAAFFGLHVGGEGLSWKDFGLNGLLATVQQPEVLFKKLEHDAILALRERYSGSQKEREDRANAAAMVSAEKHSAAAAPATAPETPALPASSQNPESAPAIEEKPELRFSALIDLRVARIINIERHPKADKLYIETLDDGSGNPRTIVSGLVPFYKEEELLGKQIVLVNNLKPAKLRGVESAGMLLAASVDGEEGHEKVEVLTAAHAKPGDRVMLDPSSTAATLAPAEPPAATVDASTFFSIPILAKNGYAWVGDARLSVAGKLITLENVRDGEIG